MDFTDLAHGDLRELVESGCEMQECEYSADLAQHAQRTLHQLIGADVVVWNELTRDGRISTGMTFPDLGDTFWSKVAPAIAAHIHEHPFVQHIQAARAVPFTAAISDLMATSRFVETGLYRQGYRQFSARHQICSAAETADGTRLVLSLNRQARDFLPRDKAILDCVARQATKAFRNLQRLENLTNQLEALRFRHQQVDSTWLYLDTRLVIQWGASGLGRFLRHHFGQPTADLFLPAPLGDQVLRHLRAWDDRRVADEHRSCEFRVEHESRGYLLRLNHQRTGIYRLIVVTLPAGSAELDASRLSPSLSHREKEVACWVAQGKTNPEIAIILGISARTVEKHVQRALEKLGVENRVQLARLVAAPL